MTESTPIAVSDAPPAPAPEVAPSPAPEGVVPALATPAEAAPAQVDASVVAPAPEPAPSPPSLDASLLSEETKKEEPAPETKPEPAPAPEPALVYEAFKLPENVSFAEERMKKFTDVLGAHKGSQELGQQLVDMHMAELTQAQEQWRTSQYKAWNDAQNGWKDQVRADPEIGGARLETALQQAKSVIKTYGGSEAEQTAVLEALTLTGAGNHPAIVRLLSRVGAALTESAPAPATPPTPQPDRALKRYNTMSNQ